MKTQEFNCMGVKVPLSVPESIAEWVEKWGEESLLREGIANVIYRGGLAEARQKLAEGVEEMTSIERKTKVVTDKEGNPKIDPDTKEEVTTYVEPEARYLKTVRVEKGWTESNPPELDALGVKIGSQIEFDPTRPEPKASAPKTAPKAFRDKAKELLDAGRGDHYAEQFSLTFGEDAEKNVLILAKALQAAVAKRMEEELKHIG